MFVRGLFYFVLAFACVMVLASPAAAQFDRGTISGVVKDQSGGVVPGATVTAKSLATQEVQTAVTDAGGYYTMTTLRPGRYDVSAELDGFKKASRTGVTLDAGAAIGVEFVLEPGNLAETVTVVAQSTPIQTDVAIRKTVEAKDIELLSFSGRNPIGVPALKPGVVGGNFNNAGFAAFSNGGFNMNGSRADENTITVDGAIAIRTRSAGTIIGVQNVDAIQEVQVLTANYLPEYGRASGGQIRFITKSGSSRYSGSASYFYRDDKLQANTWARNRSPNAIENSGPAPFNYKQYRLVVRRAYPGRVVQEQALLLRRAGVGGLLRGGHQHGHRADCGDGERRLQPAARHEPVLQHRRRSSAIRSPACRSRATSSRRTACRRTASR